MPIYAYKCQGCGAEFETLVRSSEVPVCTSCGSGDLQQQIGQISSEIKHPGIAKSWRQAAERSGDLSNISRKERRTK
jgi:putative FmdB family regulatory protein